MDDEQDFLDELAEVFSEVGYEIDTATNGAEGIKKIQINRPHIMLLDVRMPKMDGLQILNKAKQIDPTLGIIVVTAVREEEIAQAAMNYGGFDYIIKPIDLNCLRKSVAVKMIKMLGDEDVDLSAPCEKPKKKKLNNMWPPRVLVATNSLIWPVVNNMLHTCGIHKIKKFVSAEDMFSFAKEDNENKYTTILDSTVPYVKEEVENAKTWLKKEKNNILIFPDPTPKEIIEAIHAGVHDIITYPFTQKLLEKILHKQTGTKVVGVGKHIENRNSPRLWTPIVIEAPSLSDTPLVPEDAGSGGFKVVVPERPVDNSFHEMSIHVGECNFESCKVGVAWIRKAENQPKAWSVGLFQHMNDGECTLFSEALVEAHRTQN
ncbi:response regulator [Nitrospinota bacterium]